MGIDEAELHDIAVANMDLPQNYLLQSMEEAIGIEVDPSVKPEDRPEMFILTSKMKINGATVIFSEEVRQKVGKQIGGDYYLLPSSIHEWVVIPKSVQGAHRKWRIWCRRSMKMQWKKRSSSLTMYMNMMLQERRCGRQ